MGCDDTRGPHRELSPRVVTIPSDRSAAEAAYPWIAFEGRWGELQKAFFNGPTGPNLKTQWTQPITWSEDWRDRSYAVPTGGAFGTGSTDFFCTAVAQGLAGVVSAPQQSGSAGHPPRDRPRPRRSSRQCARPGRPWRPRGSPGGGHGARSSPPRRGCTCGGRCCSSASGVLLIPIAVAMTFVQWLLLGVIDALGTVSGEGAGAWAFLVRVVGTTFALLGLGLVMAATACALVEMDADRPVGAWDAYRLAAPAVPAAPRRDRALRPRLGRADDAPSSSSRSRVWLGVRWCLVAPVVELEDHRPVPGMRRSAELVRRRWIRVGSLVGVSAALALLAGPLLGAILIFLTGCRSRCSTSSPASCTRSRCRSSPS